ASKPRASMATTSPATSAPTTSRRWRRSAARGEKKTSLPTTVRAWRCKAQPRPPDEHLDGASLRSLPPEAAISALRAAGRALMADRKIPRVDLPPETRLDNPAVREGLPPSAWGENSEALFLTSSFVQPDAATAAARLANEEEAFVYSRFT